MSRIHRHFAEALETHRMISENDHILVGLSGGKDSWALLGLLCELRPKCPVPFSLSATTIDGGLVGLDDNVLRETCKNLGVPFHLERQPIFRTVAEKKDEGSTFCSMCAKMRRGTLYRVAERVGATKLALGHHLDDAIETLLLNLFFGGRVAALPPILHSNQGHVPIIRPLLYCDEDEVAEYATSRGFVSIGCACPVCPTHPDHEHSDLRRHQMKAWIRKLAAEIPDLRHNARGALRRVEPSRFLDARFAEKFAQKLPFMRQLD